MEESSLFEDLLLILASGAISGLSAGIVGYLLLNHTKKALKTELEAWLNSEKGQKAIYQIGVLLGNAIKQGVGLQTKGGSLKLDNLIGQAIAGFIQNRFNLGGQQDLSQQQP